MLPPMRREVFFVLVIAAVWSPALIMTSPVLAQAPSPRRLEPGDFLSSDSARCRQAKEDVKVLDSRLKDPEFEGIPTQAEYNLGSAWESEGRSAVVNNPAERFSLWANSRQRTLDVWGENSRQFREGEVY